MTGLDRTRSQTTINLTSCYPTGRLSLSKAMSKQSGLGSKEQVKKRRTKSHEKAVASYEAAMELEKEPTYKQLMTKLQAEGVIIDEQLGSGSYSIVYKAQVPTKDNGMTRVAVKVVCTQRDNDFVRKFLPREIQICQKIEHRCILNFFGVKDFRLDHQLPFVVFTTEFCPTDLLLKLKDIQSRGEKGMKEMDIKITFRQLVEAMSYLDKKGICHRDLKCENILLDQWENVKLGDFGFARYIGPTEKSKTHCGSRAYVAPEILLDKDYLGRPADVWSIGIILYVSGTGHFPFDDRDHEKMLKEMLNHRIRFSKKWIGTAQLRACITSLLHPLPPERPSYSEILKSDFFRDFPLTFRPIAATAEPRRTG